MHSTETRKGGLREAVTEPRRLPYRAGRPETHIDRPFTRIHPRELRETDHETGHLGQIPISAERA